MEEWKNIILEKLLIVISYQHTRNVLLIVCYLADKYISLKMKNVIGVFP